MRPDGRKNNELREIRLTPNVSEYAEGSVMVEFGKTKVLCAASFEPQVPRWLYGTEQGWVTAEYGMLPRSTHTRIRRDKALNSGRTQEISRLIGRSLRAAIDLKALGERQVTIDCDVINADGGTRTAAVTGGFVALALALHKLKEIGEIQTIPLTDYVAGVSVGLIEGQALIDLNYDEDVSIHTDMNFVMVGCGEFVEIQGTAEKTPFGRASLLQMMDMASEGCQELFAKQEALLENIFPRPKK